MNGHRMHVTAYGRFLESSYGQVSGSAAWRKSAIAAVRSHRAIRRGATKLVRQSMAEIFSTVGLVIDVAAVLALIVLSHAESGMARIIGTNEGVLQGLVLRVKVMMRHSKTLLVLNAGLCSRPVCWNKLDDTRDLDVKRRTPTQAHPLPVPLPLARKPPSLPQPRRRGRSPRRGTAVMMDSIV